MPNPGSSTLGYHASVQWSAATPPVLSNNVGFASVTRSAQGVYVATLGVGYAIDNTEAVGLASSATANAIIQIVQASDTVFNVTVVDDAHAALDAIVNLVVVRSRAG